MNINTSARARRRLGLLASKSTLGCVTMDLLDLREETLLYNHRYQFFRPRPRKKRSPDGLVNGENVHSLYFGAGMACCPRTTLWQEIVGGEDSCISFVVLSLGIRQLILSDIISAAIRTRFKQYSRSVHSITPQRKVGRCPFIRHTPALCRSHFNTFVFRQPFSG